MATEEKVVVVIGCGVIGLHAAIAALEAGYRVKMIAKHLPNDDDPHYPSPMAAATWACDENATEEETRDWYEDSYNTWAAEAVHDGEANPAGITWRTYHRYYDRRDPTLPWHQPATFWFASFVKDFRILSPEELPEDVKFGTSYSTFSVNAPAYLTQLTNRIRHLGGEITRATLSSDQGLPGALKEARQILGISSVYAYVNASGMGSKELAGDEEVFPMQSHAIHIKGEPAIISDRIDDGGIYYAIPRAGTGVTVLGGYMQLGNWSDKIDPAHTKLLLEKCSKLIPECLNENGEFEVIRDMVGLRPHRKGGPRSEVEFVKGLDGTVEPVLHCYGHGSGGFFKAIGNARKVVRQLGNLAATKV